MHTHAPANYACPFCRFSRGEVMPRNAPEDIVYADDALLAFVSPRTWPHNAGNVLIVPRAHYENLYVIPDVLLARVMVIAKRIAIAMKAAYGCDGTSLRQHNDPAGNQDVWQFHLHVFPRWAGDRLYQLHDEAREVDAEERQMYAARLRAAVVTGEPGSDAHRG
jgi:histidine triad (HIT) family protein